MTTERTAGSVLYKEIPWLPTRVVGGLVWALLILAGFGIPMLITSPTIPLITKVVAVVSIGFVASASAYSIATTQRLAIYAAAIEPRRRPLTLGLVGRPFRLYRDDIVKVEVGSPRYGVDWTSPVLGRLRDAHVIDLNAPFVGKDAFPDLLRFAGETYTAPAEAAAASASRLPRRVIRASLVIALVGWFVFAALLLTMTILTDRWWLALTALALTGIAIVMVVAWIRVQPGGKPGSK